MIGVDGLADAGLCLLAEETASGGLLGGGYCAAGLAEPRMLKMLEIESRMAEADE
jgi:hypothetical protein